MKSRSLIAILLGVSLLVGCKASHAVLIESDPEGARIERDGQLIGYAPFIYYYPSPHARCIWVHNTTLTATIDTKDGWKPASKTFKVKQPFEQRLLFELEKDFTTQEERSEIAEEADARRRQEPVPENLCRNCAPVVNGSAAPASAEEPTEEPAP